MITKKQTQQPLKNKINGSLSLTPPSPPSHPIDPPPSTPPIDPPHQAAHVAVEIVLELLDLVSPDGYHRPTETRKAGGWKT